MSPRSKTAPIDGRGVADALAATAPHRVGVLIYPGTSAYDMASAAEVFSTANSELRRNFGADRDVYAFEVIGSIPGPVTLEFGLKVVPDGSILEAPATRYDTLLVSGGSADALEAALADRQLISWLGQASETSQRIASLCTGAFLLAEAEILEGPATTHWAYCERLQKSFPRLKVLADQIHVKSGNVYSSAGSTAAMDLVLALVEEDLGRKVAMAVARRLVMFLKRAGGQSQFSSALIAQSAPRETMNGVPEWILEHLREELPVETLAARANMSPRNFARVFVAETGLTPAKYVERARVEKTRMMIEETDLPLATIAGASGFDTDRKMRRAFMRWLKVAPSDYAARFRVEANTVIAASSSPQPEDGGQPLARMVA